MKSYTASLDVPKSLVGRSKCQSQNRFKGSGAMTMLRQSSSSRNGNAAQLRLSPLND
ncbi:hypothetical protein ACU8KH_01476 [Lachancea thermotolerans]